MTELANAMSFEMWAGYSARGGQTINPYGTGDDDMFVGGSSTGSAIAVAANFSISWNRNGWFYIESSCSKLCSRYKTDCWFN